MSGLVVKQQGQLRIYNRIYKEVFNQNWVEQQLKNLRPYAQQLNAWVVSEYQDTSQLLHGQSLQEAQGWGKGKSLSIQDYRFLAASEELDKRVMQEALIAAEQANQILEAAQKQAKRTIRWGLIGLAILFLVFLLMGSAGLFVEQLIKGVFFSTIAPRQII